MAAYRGTLDQEYRVVAGVRGRGREDIFDGEIAVRRQRDGVSFGGLLTTRVVRSFCTDGRLARGKSPEPPSVQTRKLNEIFPNIHCG